MKMTTGFSAKLREFRLRSGLSQNALSVEVGVDPSYINRIERSEREPPKRDLVLKIANALSLQDHERDDLLLSAKYAPMLAEKVDLTDPEFRLMAERWTGYDTDPD